MIQALAEAVGVARLEVAEAGEVASIWLSGEVV